MQDLTIYLVKTGAKQKLKEAGPSFNPKFKLQDLTLDKPKYTLDE